MRSRFAAVLIAVCLNCTDSGDIAGADKNNLSLRIEVTGDASVAPASYRLSLDGLDWRTTSAGEDQHLFVSPGAHTVGLTPFDNIVDLGWCLQLQPSSIGARFTRNEVIYARFSVYCPSATGTGTLTMLISVQGLQSTAPLSFVLTRVVGIPGSETLSVQPGKAIQAKLTAGLYRMDLAGPCKVLYQNAPGLPAIAIRNGENASLNFNVSCTPFIFKLPPGIP